MLILNVAGGKIPPLDIDEHLQTVVINVDNSYFSGQSPEIIEQDVDKLCHVKGTINMYCNSDIWEFLERTILKFDKVTIYRFLEHVPFTQVLYFIYLLSTVTKSGSDIDIIVPNYKLLASMILHEKIDENFEYNNILLTTELLNEPSCPHASIWTTDRAIKFFELEKRFKVTKVQERYDFDGRDIYLRFIAKRI